jgi:hypothetical protein
MDFGLLERKRHAHAIKIAKKRLPRHDTPFIIPPFKKSTSLISAVKRCVIKGISGCIEASRLEASAVLHPAITFGL